MNPGEINTALLSAVSTLLVVMIGIAVRTLASLKKEILDFGKQLNSVVKRLHEGDLRFEHNDSIVERLAADVCDNRKSLHKAWENIRGIHLFCRDVKTTHNNIHPEQRVNGIDSK